MRFTFSRQDRLRFGSRPARENDRIRCEPRAPRGGKERTAAPALLDQVDVKAVIDVDLLLVGRQAARHQLLAEEPPPERVIGIGNAQLVGGVGGGREAVSTR